MKLSEPDIQRHAQRRAAAVAFANKKIVFTLTFALAIDNVPLMAGAKSRCC
jgi:hypothetical protein